MDINMPGMNGFECLKRLKKHSDFKNIRVVILSAFSDYGEQELAYSLGASFFFVNFLIFLYSKKIFRINLISTFESNKFAKKIY